MKYFKIKQNNEIIGVVSSNNFLTLQTRHNFLRISDETIGQFVSYNDKLYRDAWMRPIPNKSFVYEMAEITEIEKEIYDSYIEAIHANEEVIEIPETPEPQISTIVEEVKSDNSIADAKNFKISLLKKACHDAIEDGFNVGVSHYSLTDYDQRNIALLSSLIAQGYEDVPYHMDNGPVEYYSASKFNIVAEAAARHIIYHTTYYNALKAYVNSLEDEQAILNVQYGDEIPYEYQTAVLRDF